MNNKVLIFFLTLILLTGCRNETVIPAGEVLTRVKTTRIVPKEISIPVHSGGILLTSEEMRLSFKTGGIVEKIWKREGEKVKKGDNLASLNLAEITANVNLASNGYEKALRDWTRVKNLYADTVVTLEQYQNASTSLEAARSNLDIARFNLLHSVIKAPGDGIILKQLVRENEIVSAGYPVLVFGSSGNVWKVKTGISDKDIVRIDHGDSAVVTVDAFPGVLFRAVVEQISGISNPLTGTYDVELSLDGTGYRLSAGFIAGVDIFPAEKNNLALVPVGSLVEADGDSGYVYSINSSGIAEKNKVSIRHLTGSSAAVAGLPEGISEIVSEGAAYLKEGQRAKIVK